MIPFATAYLFTGPHALVEFSNTDTVQQLNDWRVDYVGTIGAGIRRYFGTPCANAGVTSVSSSGGTADYTIGSTVNFWSGSGQPNVSVLHTVGLSATDWNGLPLPFDFAPLGAPGCNLLVGASVMTGFARNANGTVNRQITIPNSPALGNLTFYAQWANLDPAANAMGLSLTEATAITIGAPRITGIASTRLVSEANNTSATGVLFNNEMPVLRLTY